jgi:hypothetical protein
MMDKKNSRNRLPIYDDIVAYGYKYFVSRTTKHNIETPSV